MHFRSILTLILVVFYNVSASAAPTADCAKTFIGTWTHQSTNGMSNMMNLTSEGAAICSANPFCQQGTWTCNANVLIYNNGMFNTPYTLTSPNTMLSENGANTMTRVGQAPAAGRAEPSPAEPAFRPDPVTNVAPKSRDDARGLGRSYLTAARAADQYCSYADKMKASESYQVAARYFAQAGDRAAASNAERAGMRASQDADRCERQRSQASAPAPARGQAGGPASQESCAEGLQYAERLAAQGTNVDRIRMRLAGLGCPVDSLPQGKSGTSLRACLSLRSNLESEGKSAEEVRSQLGNARCPAGAMR